MGGNVDEMCADEWVYRLKNFNDARKRFTSEKYQLHWKEHKLYNITTNTAVRRLMKKKLVCRIILSLA